MVIQFGGLNKMSNSGLNMSRRIRRTPYTEKVIEAAFQEKKPIVVVIDNNGGLDCISQQQERLFESGKHFATDFRDIPFQSIFEGFGGHGELVTKREDLGPALKRALESGKTACVNVKAKGVISPIVAAVSDKRDKASIE